MSFDDKIDKWIPMMAGGRKLDKGTQRWERFKELRAIGDQEQAHSKQSVVVSNYKQLAGFLNLFRTGSAVLLLDLHVHFDQRKTPSSVIRYAFLPDVECVQQDQASS